ncbi:hypothetical protein Tco_0216520 [Tanacetum coccineum]
MTISKIQVNTNFVNHLQPEWSMFVTAAKQAKDLHNVNFDQLCAFLKHNKKDAKEVREIRQRYPDPLALVANTYNPPPSYNSQRSQYNPPPTKYHPYQSYQPNTPLPQQQIIYSPPQQSYEPLVVQQHSPAPSTQLDSGFVNSRNNLRWSSVHNVQGRQSEGHTVNMGKSQATGTRAINTVGDANENQLRADLVDAYDSYCDDEATASAIFMASISPAGSINGDTVGLAYDSDILSKIPHYDTYHETGVLNSVVQETEYSEHFVSNNDSYDELMSDKNVISYDDYIVNIENDVAQYVPPPEQDNAMILSVIEQMKSQVEQCNMVNQEIKIVNESLSSELERYQEKVKALEERQNSKEFFTKREEHLDSQMQGIIIDRNEK